MTTTTEAALVGPLASLNGKVILVDPGHNGRNYQHPEINEPVDIRTQTRACDTTGAQTNDGYTESAFNMDLSIRVADLLRAAGATVVLTRADNEGWGPCIDRRAAIGNEASADVGISIHADGGPPNGRGFHLIYPESIPGLTEPIASQSFRLALALRDSFGAGTGTSVADYIARDGLDERRDLGGLNLSTIPKVFIETANMRNADDAALLEDEGFRQRAAEAIVQGLATYFTG